MTELSKTEQKEKLESLLDEFSLQKIRTNRGDLLSGGERRRTEIARALASNPKFILLDEPFGHLDAHLRQKLSSHLMDLRDEEDTGIILVSHEGQDVLGLCDHICILQNGKLSKKQKPEAVYYHYKAPERARLFGPLNTLKIDTELLHFRPDEYKVSDTGVAVQFEKAMFVGGLYHNFVRSSNNERLLLYAFEKLTAIQAIEIHKK